MCSLCMTCSCFVRYLMHDAHNLIPFKTCSHIRKGAHLDLILWKEEGCLASGPVLYKCAVGHHLVMDSGERDGGQEVVAQLYQPAHPSSKLDLYIISFRRAKVLPVHKNCLTKGEPAVFASILSKSAMAARQKLPDIPQTTAHHTLIEIEGVLWVT